MLGLQNRECIEELAVPFESFTLHADISRGESSDHLLCIHGGGKSNRRIFDDLRQAQFSRGVGSTALDCIGHGSTAGALECSSLQSRDRQVAAVIRNSGLPPSSVLGISMGAYNAIRLTQYFELDALILVVPGVYTPAAYNIPFGPDFSRIIRQHESWAASDAWEILARFEGRLLVVAAEHDAVIPLAIPERLVASATRASERTLLIVPDAGHSGVIPLLMGRSEWKDAVASCVSPDLP